MIEPAEVEDIAFAHSVARPGLGQLRRIGDGPVLVASRLVGDANAFGGQVQGIHHVLPGVLGYGNDQRGVAGRASNEAHIGFDPGTCLVGWQPQRNHIVDSNDGRRAREKRWGEIWHVIKVGACLSCRCRAAMLFPYQFFNVLVAASKRWHGIDLVGKRYISAAITFHGSRSQQEIFVLLVDFFQGAE